MPKVRPTNGVSYGAVYEIPADGVNVAAVQEVVTLIVTAGASASANATVTLPSLAGVPIALLNTDTLTTQVATKIRAGTFTGWTTGGSASTVTFTRNAAGAVTGTPVYAPDTTGTAASITISTLGADAIDGYVDFDFRQGSSFYRFNLVAVASVLAADGTSATPSGFAVTYPAPGVVRVNGVLVAGTFIHITVQASTANYA
jgi:hypothetical protein